MTIGEPLASMADKCGSYRCPVPLIPEAASGVHISIATKESFLSRHSWQLFFTPASHTMSTADVNAEEFWFL